MRYRVIFRPIAREQALRAVAFIADRGNPENARRWLVGLEEEIDSLSTMPRRCGLARESAAFPSRELRQLLYKSHRVIFTIRNDEVCVLQIRHVAQDNLESLEELNSPN